MNKFIIPVIHIEDFLNKVTNEEIELLSLDIEGIDNLYKDICVFVENFELKQLEDIKKQNFSSIAGMRKKEALEKTEEINSFSFLLHNI